MKMMASTAGNFGQDFLDQVRKGGSIDVAAPLLSFLQRSDTDAPLRPVVKLSRPALKADIAHFLNICFGKHPGIVDHAASKIVDQNARQWLVQAIDGFAVERAFLNRLTVAAGPIHRQLGQERVTALVEGQSHSVEMLATSDRAGCAAGAAIAFVLDWQATRPLLEHIGYALLIDVPECSLPDSAMSLDLVRNLSAQPAVQRALQFGCDQMLGLQRGLWQVISARHQAMLAEQ
jgi:hypothetical protein